MIVPEHWAEARLQHREPGRQVTLRRFGWSDASPAEAQALADARVREAMQRVLAGDKLARRDPKIAYNGAEGVPIREQIVERHGSSVITRNGYGARCLNTPDVLFADIDFGAGASARATLAVGGMLVLLAAAVGRGTASWGLGIALGLLALFIAAPLSGALHRFIEARRGGAQAVARRRIASFVQRHPAWNLRVYRTPAGLRLLATHALFHPRDAAVVEAFRAFDTDPLYARMCHNQQCFRARVSAKPWRIGLRDHLKPRPGVWPVAPDRLPARNAWVDAYERRAAAYAACEFVESLGSGTLHPQVQPVQDLHDQLCGATSGRPLA